MTSISRQVSFAGHRSQVTGHMSQVTGHRSQVTGQKSTKPGNTSTTAIQATPASVFVQHNQLSVNSNSMASFAHGDRGQRSPPHFNFYNCTNVHIHNNFGPSSRISFVNILGVSFQLFCDVNFINLTFFD